MTAKDWLAKRVEEHSFEWGIDGQVLCVALQEIEVEQLGNEDVIKIWLGLDEDEDLPKSMSKMIEEFRERRYIELLNS